MWKLAWADSSTHVLTALPRGRIPEQVRGTEVPVSKGILDDSLMTLASPLEACLTQMGQEEELDRDERTVDDKLELLKSHRYIDGPYCNATEKGAGEGRRCQNL